MKKGRKQGICVNPKCGQRGELRAHDLCSKCEPKFRTKKLPPDAMDMVYEHIQTQNASKNKLDEMLDEQKSKKKEVDDSIHKLQLALKMGIHVDQGDIDTLADIGNRYLRALLPEETESESQTSSDEEEESESQTGDEETKSELPDATMPPENKVDVEAQTQTHIEENKSEAEPSPAIQTQTQKPNAAPTRSQILRHESHIEDGRRVAGCTFCDEMEGKQAPAKVDPATESEPGVKERVRESLITQGLTATQAIHYENEAVGVVFNDRLINAVSQAMNDWPLIEKLRVKKSLAVVNAWKYFNEAQTLLPNGDDDAIVAKACELADIGCAAAKDKKKATGGASE